MVAKWDNYPLEKKDEDVNHYKALYGPLQKEYPVN